MTDIDQILEEGIEAGTEVFRESYQATGYINTGASYETIQPRPAAQSIVANPAIYSLVFGRRPSEKFPPWGYKQGTEDPTDLMQWTKDVFGLTLKEARGISFLVARKIKEQGNQVHQGIKEPIPTEPTIDKVNEVVFNKSVKNVLDIFKTKNNGLR